jgi:ubiquinone/menaquinone biosynthesis C-methylase UbiE
VEKEAIWSKVAPARSEQVTAQFQLMWNTLLDATRVGTGTKFLDAGCGNGGASALAQQLGARVTGVDASAEMIKLAAERVPDGTFQIADLEKLPFPDGHFDAIIASQSIHFATSVLGALKEVRRVLSPTGRFAVTSPGNLDEFALHEVFAAAYNVVWPSRPVDLFRVAGPGVMEGLLEAAGLALISKQKFFQSFRFPDLESAWAFTKTLGSVAAVIREAGEDVVRAPIMRVLQRHERARGQVWLEGWVPYFVARTGAPTQ